LDPRLPGNKGIDSIFVKRNAQDQVTDIVVVESKYATKGGKPKLAWSGKRNNKTQQLSNAWMDKQLKKMKDVHPDIHKLLKQNEDKIRFKANVLDEKGINRWYDYGKYTPGDITNKAIRTVTRGTSS
jgi:predicted patatin/cPLA2 family phospholipase